jgi:hypothetical protein
MSKYKLPNEILKIENADKTFHEKWHTGRDICDFPHPVRIGILGKVGLGKSTIAKNIFLRSQASDNPYEQLLIIHGSDSTKEWDDLEPTMILNDIPDPQDLTQNDKKTMIIIDDFEMSGLPKQSLKNLSSLFRFVSSHHNISVIICYQSFFDMPSIIKKCCNVFIIYRPNDRDELGTIARRVGMTKKDMLYIFDNFMKEKRDTLCIDMTEDSPAPLRKNLFTPIMKSD